MSFLAQIQDLKFPNIPASHDGHYRFQVTEIHPGISPVAYHVEVPDGMVKFAKSTSGYVMQVNGNPFAALESKVAKLACEAYIYPRFIKNN